MAFTPEQLELYNRLSNEGDYEGAYQALYGNYVAPEPAASASGLLSSLGLGSADAGALQGLLSQFRRAEEERQFADAGRDEAPIGDHQRDEGFGDSRVASEYRFGKDKTDAELEAIEKPKPYSMSDFAGGLGFGAASFLKNRWEQDRYDKSQELLKNRRSQFDFDKDYTTTTVDGSSVIDPEQSIYVDLEAGGTEAQKNYIENYFAERGIQQSDLQRQNVLDNPSIYGDAAAADLANTFGFGDGASIYGDPFNANNLSPNIPSLLSQTDTYGDPFNAGIRSPDSNLLNKLNAEFIATPSSTPLTQEDQIIQMLQNESKRVRDITAGLKSIDAEKANKAAGYQTHPDNEERYQEPSFAQAEADRGDIFGGYSGGGLL